MSSRCRGVPAAVLPVLAVLLLAGCGDDGPTLSTGSPSPSPTESATESPSAEAGTATPSATAPVPASGTPTAAASATSPSPPPRTTGATATPAPARPAPDGDVDGDGRADRVSVSDPGTGVGQGRWLLTVRLTGGGTATGTATSEDPAPPAVVGVVDADGDGRGEVWLRTAQGASTSFLTPYRLVARRLAETTLDGEAARLGVGGGVTHGDGFACQQAVPGGVREVVVTMVDSDDGRTFRGRRRVLAWRGTTLATVSSTTFAAASDADPRVRAAYTVACGSLEP